MKSLCTNLRTNLRANLCNNFCKKLVKVLCCYTERIYRYKIYKKSYKNHHISNFDYDSF